VLWKECGKNLHAPPQCGWTDAAMHKEEMLSTAPGENRPDFNEQALREMNNFVRALRSYPDHFAQNPELTFEEHCLIEAAKIDPSHSRA